MITPDGMALRGVHEMCKIGWDIAGPEHARELGIVFPLGEIDWTDGEVMLHKTSPDAEWTVMEHTLESGLYPISMAEGQTTPTFREWLRALTEGITSARLILGQYSAIDIGPEDTPLTQRHLYPWRW